VRAETLGTRPSEQGRALAKRLASVHSGAAGGPTLTHLGFDLAGPTEPSPITQARRPVISVEPLAHQRRSCKQREGGADWWGTRRRTQRCGGCARSAGIGGQAPCFGTRRSRHTARFAAGRSCRSGTPTCDETQVGRKTARARIRGAADASFSRCPLGRDEPEEPSPPGRSPPGKKGVRLWSPGRRISPQEGQVYRR
jgi:hypothetical protein